MSRRSAGGGQVTASVGVFAERNRAGAFGLLAIVAAISCTAARAQTEPADDLEASQLRTVELISAPPSITCDPRASERTEVRVRHIYGEAPAPGVRPGHTASLTDLLRTYSRMHAAREALAAGLRFEVAWKMYSDPSLAGRNPDGDLGFEKRGMFPREFDREAFCLPVGEISPVFRTPYGFHVMQVIDVRY